MRAIMDYQRVNYGASVLAGRMLTYADLTLVSSVKHAVISNGRIVGVINQVAPMVIKHEQSVKQVIAPVVISKGKALYEVMMNFFKMGLKVHYNRVGKLKFIVGVEWNKESFPVTWSEKMQRVVVWDCANKKSLKVQQFVSMVGDRGLVVN